MKFLLILMLTVLAAQADPGQDLVTAARKQIGVTRGYDPAYTVLAYPGGDVDPAIGVCTDVVIRAMRIAFARDLQKLVHEDMKANFSAYPKIWGLKRPDKNIDHRRVPNLRVWFKRQGWQLPLADKPDFTRFQAGDLVTCTLPPSLPHIMIVSDRKSPEGVPLVIHNIGGGTQEEDLLAKYPMTGHYRPR